MPFDVTVQPLVLLQDLVVGVELFKLASVWVRHEVKTIGAGSFEASTQNLVTLFVFENKVDVFLALVFLFCDILHFCSRPYQVAFDVWKL